MTPKLDVLVSTVGAKLDALLSALNTELGTVAASILGKLDAFTIPADAKLDSIGGKLISSHQKSDLIQATVNDTDAKLDRAEFKRDEDKREIINAVWSTGRVVAGAAVGCLVLLLGGVVLLSGRSRGASVPEVPPAHELATVTPQPPPVVIVATVGQGGAPLMFDLRTLLGAVAGQMGEKVPPEQYIHTALLPGQKPPPCNARLKEEAINGGCWTHIVGRPPCEMLFRHDDGCYRPVAADPLKPVMVSPSEPGQEAP